MRERDDEIEAEGMPTLPKYSKRLAISVST
jgi:hypothetical protein